MQLRDILLVLMTAGAGGAVYWLMENVGFLRNLAPEWKRYVSLALSALIPVLAWLVGALMLYWDAPGDWRAWIEAIFAVAAGGIITSQSLHGALKLRGRDVT